MSVRLTAIGPLKAPRVPKAGVGLNVIQGARVAGADRIIAVDVAAWKLELARTFGATDTVNASESDPVELVKQMTGGLGVTVAFEVIGHTSTMEQMIAMTRPGGQCIFTGTPAEREASLPLSPGHLVGTAKTFKGNMLGMSNFHEQFPRLVSLYQEGTLLIDQLISRTIDLSGVNDAFDAMHAGAVARSVINFQ